MKRIHLSLLILLLVFPLIPLGASIASMSEKAFVFLEALDVLEDVNIISSLEYVVNQESVDTLIEQQTIVADQQPMFPYLLLAIHKPTLILTDRDEFKEVLIPKVVLNYKGEAPLEKLELLLTLGELFDKEEEAYHIYNNHREEYLNLVSYVERLDNKHPSVTLFSDDKWLISLFKDAQVEVIIEEGKDTNNPLLLINREGEELWYSFSKRNNGYGYSDINSSAILYPQYILHDIISLLYLSVDESTLTYIKRVERLE